MAIETETSLPAPPPDGAAPPSSSKGGFDRIVEVLFSPGETFREIAAKPNYLVPILVIVVLSVVGSVVIAPRVDFESMAREQIEQANPDMAAADVDRAARMGGAVSKAFLYFAPLANLLFLALIAGIFLIAFRLFGGEGSYGQAFSVTLHAWMPMVISSIIGMVIILARGSADAEQLQNLVMSNPAFLVDMKAHPVLYTLLKSIDLFVIWTLALFILGFAHVSKMSVRRSATLILSLWAVLLVFRLGFAAMAAAKMRS